MTRRPVGFAHQIPVIGDFLSATRRVRDRTLVFQSTWLQPLLFQHELEQGVQLDSLCTFLLPPEDGVDVCSQLRQEAF